MEYEDIRVADDEHVRVITLDRPARRNAMTWRMHSELADAMAGADGDDDVHVVVLTGAPPAFCAGMDMTVADQTWTAPAGTPARVGLEPRQVRKPVLAAINGHAIGVGLTYPMQCDVRFVAADAKLGFVFTRRGVAPELGSHHLLPRVVGFSRAADLLLSGRTFTGEEAASIGLASAALAAADVLPATLAYAHELATACSPTSTAIVKELLWAGLERDAAEVRRLEDSVFVWLSRQPDATEGVVAWSEWRAPQWSGLPSARPPHWPGSSTHG